MSFVEPIAVRYLTKNSSALFVAPESDNDYLYKITLYSQAVVVTTNIPNKSEEEVPDWANFVMPVYATLLISNALLANFENPCTVKIPLHYNTMKWNTELNNTGTFYPTDTQVKLAGYFELYKDRDLVFIYNNKSLVRFDGKAMTTIEIDVDPLSNILLMVLLQT